MEFPNDPKPSDEEMINSYVNILAQVVGRLLIFPGFFVFCCGCFLFLVFDFWVLLCLLIVFFFAARKRRGRRFTLFLPQLILDLVL